MKARTLLAAVSVFVLSLMSAFAGQQEIPQTPVVYVRGLAMLQLEDQDNMRIALPDAPGHDATITLIMHDGRKSAVPFKGHGTIRVSDSADSRPIVNVPELVRMKELYSSALKPRLDRSAKTISIPWTGIRRVATEHVSDVRYTFVRKDTGEEVQTFRPRKIAETIRIELASSGKLEFGKAREAASLDGVKAVWIEYLPQDMTRDNAYLEHFHHYVHYVDRPSGYQFDVEPKKLSGAASPAPRAGNSFWLGLGIPCYVLAVD